MGDCPADRPLSMSPAASSAPAASAASPTGAGLKVSTQPRPNSRLALEVEVPGERSRSSYERALEQLSRSVKLPGFRKGKVPRSVLLQQIGPLRVRATALEELVDSVFRQALEQEKIAGLSQPVLAGGFEAVLERFVPGSDLSFTLELDVEPSPTLKATKGLKAEAEPVAYDPARVNELLEDSRRQRGRGPDRLQRQLQRHRRRDRGRQQRWHGGGAGGGPHDPGLCGGDPGPGHG